MPEKIRNEYRPEVVSCPGETLLEILQERGMTQAELAERMGRPKKTINEIANGRAEITPETALQLERVLGAPSSVWGNLERNFREYLARSDERRELLRHVGWSARFPIRQMIRFDWLEAAMDEAERVRSLLSFFGVSSVAQWETRYRGPIAAFRLPKKFPPDVHALTAWLREGERRAQAIDCEPFEMDSLREMLRGARTLTRESDPQVFVPQLTKLGARCGVAIVFVRELKGSRASGATRWQSPQKAMIQLSLRYKSNDQLWFTFFHEAGHIVLHGKREAFVELGNGGTGTREREEEANRFSAEHLIPQRELQLLLEQQPVSRERIVSFSQRIGVAPGIVVGRLQHDKHIDFSQFNDLKVRYEWALDRN